MERGTHPKLHEVVDDRIVETLRKKSPAERIQMAADAHDTARALVAAGIHHVHPDWPAVSVQAEVARRMLDAAD
jgi:Rv0078B-related antitoxin